MPPAAPAPKALSREELDNISGPLAAYWHICCFNSATGRKGFPRGDRVTPFHSAVKPSAAITDYVVRLAIATATSADVVHASLILVGRYCAASGTMLSVLTAHRLFAAAMSLAMKAYHDKRCSMRKLAVACGLPFPEMVHLEWTMAVGVDFRLYINPREWSRLTEQSAVLLRALVTRDLLRQYAVTDNITQLIEGAATERLDLCKELDAQLEDDRAEEARVTNIAFGAMGIRSAPLEAAAPQSVASLSATAAFCTSAMLRQQVSPIVVARSDHASLVAVVRPGA